MDVEVEPPPSGVGNPEALRDSREGLHQGTSPENYRKSNSQSLSRGRASECAKAWLEGMT
jgi:hypothetical protein